MTDPQAIGTELEAETVIAVRKLANFAIRDVGDLERAVLDRQDLGARTKAVVAFFEPFKRQAHQLWRSICDRENAVLGPIEAVDTRLKRAITEFKTEADRIRREEEQRQADVRRQEEQTRLTTEAAHLETSGEAELAAAVMEQAIAVPTPVVVLPDQTRAVDGLKFRLVWKWRFVGDNRARAEQLIPRAYMTADDKKIGAIVRAGNPPSIPGVESWSEQVPVR